MKRLKTILIVSLTLIIFSPKISGQTLNETKDFISEKVKANPPASRYRNYIFWGNNIKEHVANKVAQKSLTKNELKYLFIYTYEVMVMRVDQYIDIRDIKKISTIRNTKGNYKSYVIKLYLHHNYSNNKRTILPDEEKNEYLNNLKISVAQDKEIATKIKKAIIHLGKLHGISITDGDDLF